MLNQICFDVFEKICMYLDVDSLLRLQHVSSTYKHLFTNEYYLKKLLITKIMKKLKVKATLDINYDDNKVIKDILQLFRYFNSVKGIRKRSVDKLIYAIENELGDNILEIILFDINTKIPTSDIEYIIQYCNKHHFKLLTKYVYIPSQIIEAVVVKSLYNQNNDKLKMLIDYFLLKNFVNGFDHRNECSFRNICCHITKCFGSDIMLYIFKKKKLYKFDLDYETLINTALKYKKFENFKILHNKIETTIVIHTSTLFYLCIECEIDILDFICLYYMTDVINNKEYVDAIIDGLNHRKQPKTGFETILKYLNDENQQRILCSI